MTRKSISVSRWNDRKINRTDQRPTVLRCCRKKNTVKKRRLRLKMPPLTRARGGRRDDVKALAADMCPNGASDSAFRARDAIV